MQKWLFTVSAAALLWACGNNDTHADHKSKAFQKHDLSPVEALYKEVMEGHDVGMAKIGVLNKSKIAVQQLLDSIQTNRLKVDTSYTNALQRSISSLEDAYKSMFDWMDYFKADSASDDETKRMQYLESEKQAVIIVKDKILNSIRQADSLLSEKVNSLK